jgi:hemerythrin superfamily protein
MSTTHKTAMDLESDKDAVDLLMADHQRVARLFAEFDALKGEGSDEAKSTLVARICRELIVHTGIEEEIFYPAVRTAIEDDELMDEALVEHAGAKVLIAQLQTADPDDDLYDARVTVLGEQISHHVDEEEGSLFPQAKASGIDLVSLGAALLTRKTELLANPRSPLTVATKANDDDLAGTAPVDGSSSERVSKSKASKKTASKRSRKSA